MIRLRCISISIFVLIGCKANKEDGAKSFLGAWRLQKVFNNTKKTIDDGDKLLRDAADRETVNTGIALSIFEDGTFTEVIGTGAYKQGKWQFIDKDRDNISIGNHYLSMEVKKGAKERKAKNISFEFSQGIIQIYSGSIGILPRQYIKDSWKNAFTTEEGAVHAYNMFANCLDQSDYKGASTGDGVEDDYNILLSIYADLKKASANGKIFSMENEDF